MNQLVFERTYDAPIKKVWKAITDKNQMKEWYFELEEFKAEPGFEFSFYGGKDDKKYLHKCKVVEAHPVTKLSYTWSYDGYPGTSLVTFDLAELPGTKTKLTLTHSGLDSFPANEPDLAAENFSEGWNFITGTSLRDFVETDIITKKSKIKASAEAVWKVLLDPNNKWANSFGEGALAQTDWNEGSPIIWTDLNGAVGARGIVKKKVENTELVLSYYDEIEPKAGEMLGEYIEVFKIDPAPDGTVTLIAESGPLAKKYIPTHSGMWDKAIENIQRFAENIK
ncbi:SRPBCC family protein [Flavitalea sp.]|nr:SRPBCC family protein [Flavitalea sp.]